MILKKAARKLLGYINRVLPKFNQVIIQPGPNTESNAIAVANYVSEHYDMPVYYVVFNDRQVNPKPLLLSDVIVLNYYWGRWNNLVYFWKNMTAKFIFLTHGRQYDLFAATQTVTNIWHGVLYKKLGIMNGEPPRPADITVATSKSTREMFAAAFGVPKSSTFVSGYPRNDMLLGAKNNRSSLKKKLNNLRHFEKIAIWMPTYRKHKRNGRNDGVEVGNPFYVKDFNIDAFNKLLKNNHALCLVKPHPYAPAYENSKGLSNVHFIDNEWITLQGLTLYQLLGCTDILISDVSSVIIDYMLMDQPIICVSTDFEEYRKTRGFYFDDIEHWIPSRINTNQESFFNHLKYVLKNEADPSEKKRERLKTYFFDYQDTFSTERLVKYVLE